MILLNQRLIWKLLVFSIFILLLSFYFYFNSLSNKISNDQLNYLKASNNLKKNEVLNWRSELISAIRYFNADDKFARYSSALSSINTKKDAEKYFNTIFHSSKPYRYFENVFITNTAGDLLYSLYPTSEIADKILLHNILLSIEEDSVIFGDFYFHSANKKIYSEIISPIKDNSGNTTGTVIQQVNPARCFSASYNSEKTFLLRKEYDKIFFLSGQNNNDKSELYFSISLKEKNNIAVKGISELKNFIEGENNQGKEVVAFIDTIPGTSWYIISEVSKDLIYGNSFLKTVQIVFVIIILLLVIVAVYLTLFKSKQFKSGTDLLSEKNNFYESQKEFANTLDALGDGIITTGIDGNINYINDVAQKLTGWEEIEAVGKPLDECFKTINEFSRLSAENHFQKILSSINRSSFTNHTLLISKSGKEIPISDRSAPIKDKTGKITGVVVVFRDQTVERKIQNTLIERENRFSNLVSNLPGFVYRCVNDHNWTMEYISEGSFDITGYTPDDFIDNKTLAFNDIIHPGYQQQIWEKWQKILSERNYFEYEYPIIHKSGILKWVWERGRGIYSDEGTLLYLEGFITDITERRHAVNALTLSEAKLRESQNVAQIGHFDLDILTGIWSCSTMLDEIFGIDKNFKHSLEGWNELLHPDDKTRMTDHLMIHVIQNRNRFDSEYRILRYNDKQEIWVHGLGKLECDDNGMPVKMFGTIQDITNRKRSEEYLRKSEAKLSSIFRVAPTGIGVVADNVMMEVNEQLCEMTMYSKGELLGKSLDLFFPVNNENDTYEEIKNSEIKNHGFETIETRWQRKDGEVIDILLSSTLINPTDPEQGITFTATDITRLKNAENEIRMFKFVSDHAPDAVFWMKSDAKFYYVNDQACKSLGYTRDELMKLNLFDIDPIYPRGEWEKSWNSFHSKKIDIEQIETFHKRRDGSLFPVEVIAQHYWFNNSDLHISFVRDITERKLSQNALKESELLYRTLVETSPDSITVTDKNGCITFISNRALELFGYSSLEEVAGLNIMEWISEDDRENAVSTMNYLLTNKIINPTQYILYRKDKSQFWAEVIGSVIQAPDGSVKGLIIITRDISERKSVEKALQESESSYRGLFNSVSESIYVLDEKGIFIDLNECALKMYGYTKEELVGKTPEFVSAEGKNDLTVVSEMLVKAFKGEKQKFEFWGKRKNGSTFLKEVRLYPGKYFNKVVTIAMAQDITELKKSETIRRIQYNIAEAVVSLKSLTELFSTVRNELSNIINVKNFFIAQYDEKTGMLRSDIDEDEKEKITTWSAKNSMTGYVIETRKSLLLTKQEINKLIESGAANMIGIIPEAWLGVPFKISGKVVGVLVVQSYDNAYEYDNSSRELLEIIAHELSIFIQHKKNEEQTLKLSAAVEQSSATIVITDLNGDIEYVNPKFTEVTGYKFDEVKGQNPRILKSGHKSVAEYKEMWDTIFSGKEWRGEFLNKKKNSELFWESATISPIINNNQITNFIAIKEDITAQKKLTEELISAKKKAEEMNRIKSYFYANMSHELRTPFVGILGYSELLSESLTDPDQREMAEQILTSSRRLTDTLNKVLNITKLEFDKIEPGFDNTNIFQLISNLQSLFQISAEQKSTVINTEFLCEPFTMRTDEKILREILINLISNAIKFTTDGVITISVNRQKEVSKETLIIKVADTGVGIPKEKQQIIWLEFRQASEGFNRSFEGTGLGLTIAKKYTELLDGQIFVESEIGKGSVFTVELPIINKSNESLLKSDLSVHLNKGITIPLAPLNPQILYVEDDLVSKEFVKVVLSKNNFDIETAPDAEVALKMIREKIYDILLIDINLGYGMDGLELTNQIRKIDRYSSVPIIAITAYASDTDKDEFLTKGFSHYLSKPFTINELNKLLTEALM